MDPTAQDLLTVAAGAVPVALVTALAFWLFIKGTAAKLAPVALLLIGFVVEVFFVNRQPYVQIGLQIYPNDLVSMAVFLATLIGFAYRPLPIHASPFLLWLGFGLTIIASFVIGLNKYGRYAGTEVRPFFYVWVAGLYCSANEFDEAELRRIARWCLWTAYAVMAIALYYFIGVTAGLVNRQEVFLEAETATLRPVAAHAVLFTACVGLVQMTMWLRGTGTRLAGLHAAAFMAFTVVLQHRSVWVSAAVGVLAVAVLERRYLPRRFGLLLGFALAIVLVVAGVGATGALDDLARRLTESTLSMMDSGGTFAARIDGWVRLLEQWLAAPPQTLLFGFPFGSGYTRMYNGVIIEFAPHNYFIDLLLRVGIVGTLLFLVPTVMAMVHGLTVKATSEFDYLLSRGLGVSLLVALFFCIAYPSNYSVSAATGLALAHLMRTQRLRRLQALPRSGAPLPGQAFGPRPGR